MKNKNILIVMSAFLLVFTMFSVNAQPDAIPFQEFGLSGLVSYEIDFPKLDIAYYNESFDFNTHLKYNNGTHLLNIIPENNVTCHLDGYDLKGTNTLHLDLTDLTPLGDVGHYYASVPETFFNFVGAGYYTLHCEDINKVTGLVSNPFIVESDMPIVDNGKLSLNLNNTVNLIMLGLMILAILMLVIYGQLMYSGLLTLILGFILLFSSGNYLLSGFVVLLGLGQFYGSK